MIRGAGLLLYEVQRWVNENPRHINEVPPFRRAFHCKLIVADLGGIPNPEEHESEC
jgi:hypothetical protein